MKKKIEPELYSLARLMYFDMFGLDKCNCKAQGGGTRGSNKVKTCSYTCHCVDGCDNSYTKTISVSAGSGGSAICKGQWEDLWKPSVKTGWIDFNINTDGIWDKLFNSDFVDALKE